MRELSTPGETSRLAAAAGAALDARGYKAQVTPAADSTALFALGETREPIKRTPGGFAIGDRQVSGADLVAEATAHPERFSPNVLLRPLVQDTLFPTIAYVGGPSEVAYFAQLKDVYAHFDLPMPLIVPRATATFVDGAGLRFLQQSGVELGALQARDDGALNRLLEQTLPREVEDALQAVRADVEGRMAAVIAAVPAVDATLEGTARSTLGKMTHELATLHQKVVQAAKRRDDTLRRQFERTRALAFPGGEPQERAIGLVWLLNRIGPALPESWIGSCPSTPPAPSRPSTGCSRCRRRGFAARPVNSQLPTANFQGTSNFQRPNGLGSASGRPATALAVPRPFGSWELGVGSALGVGSWELGVGSWIVGSWELAPRRRRAPRALAPGPRRAETRDEPCRPPRSRAPAFRPPPPGARPAASGAGCAT